MSDKSMYEQLAASVGPMAHLPNNGASYHTGEQVITHLNRVLGPGNWSFRVIEQGEESDSDECWAFGEITAVIDGVTVVKQDYGSQAFKRARSTGKYVSKWDDKKSAMTDALKRCARLLGVGLDAWANERAPSWRPEMADDEADMREAKRAPRPAAPSKDVAAAAAVTGAPTPINNERAELVTALEKGIAYARKIGLDPALPPVADMSNADLQETVDALRTQCRLVLDERKKQGA